MRWTRDDNREDIEDRRDDGGGGGGIPGGRATLGIGGIVLLGVLSLVFQRDLVSLKQAVDRKPLDANAIAEAGRKVEGGYEQYPAEANQSRLVGVQIESEALEALAEVDPKRDQAEW